MGQQGVRRTRAEAKDAELPELRHNVSALLVTSVPDRSEVRGLVPRTSDPSQRRSSGAQPPVVEVVPGSPAKVLNTSVGVVEVPVPSYLMLYIHGFETLAKIELRLPADT